MLVLFLSLSLSLSVFSSSVYNFSHTIFFKLKQKQMFMLYDPFNLDCVCTCIDAMHTINVKQMKQNDKLLKRITL